jgi:hypothetical protein
MNLHGVRNAFRNLLVTGLKRKRRVKEGPYWVDFKKIVKGVSTCSGAIHEPARFSFG